MLRGRSRWADITSTRCGLKLPVATNHLNYSADLVSEHLAIIIVSHYDADMRTTLTIDDDIADALRERARLLDLPFKQVVNDALRRGMSPGTREAPSPEYRVVPRHSGFVPGTDPLKLNQINDQLDTDSFSVPGAA